MIPARWETPDFEDDDPSAPGRPLPILVSLHFLRSALRRRRVACALSAVLGLLAAAAFLVAFPASHDAKAMLVLAHDPQADPLRAMSTDVSLLTSRTVAAKTIAELRLTMTPDDFLSNVTAEPVSSDLVSLTLAGPTDAEAVRRLRVLTSTYLDFRAVQLSAQSTALVEGINQRVAELQGQIEDLTQQIDQLSEAGDSGANDAISQRSQVTEQIVTLQQSAQEAALRSTTIVSSSGVIDPAAAETGGEKRRIVFTLMSGLIGGAALGCGAVLVVAITSDRLRRRFDVAAALEVPVPISVGRIAPIPRRWLWLPKVRALDARRADYRRRLAHAIEMELPGPGRWGRLAVACVDNADEVRFAVATAATDLAADGRGVVLIDLSEHGGVDAAVTALMAGQTVAKPTVLRPRGIPALAVDPADLRVVGHEDEEEEEAEEVPLPDLTDVSLVLADLNPSVGADHLTVWTERVIVAVTSGLSSAERVRTAGDLVRAAGLDLRFAALLRADGTDVSSGAASPGESTIQKPERR
jgi:hypothetical protein